MKTINSKNIKKSDISPEQKCVTTVYLKKETYAKIDSIINLSECKSRNEVIEKAVDYLFGRISAETSQEFLCDVYGKQIEGYIKNLGNRLSRMQFKNAVELDMLTRLLSNDLELSKESYDKLRKKSVDSVKQTNGSINILNASAEDEIK